jgi:N-glycosylase/DNA lyase
MNRSRSAKEKQDIKELKTLYGPIKGEIKRRLGEFQEVWERGSEEEIFAELVFCLLTPQSKARSCDYAVTCLLEKDLVLQGDKKEIARELRTKTRFHNNKASYVVEARNLFSDKGKMKIKKKIADYGDPVDARKWLVANIKGMGLKEASHFLRNIGFGEELAILDRHILKNLVILEVIPEIPKSLSTKVYYEIEKKMMKFSKEIRIPLAHLDLLLWYKEAGEVFK